MKLSTLCYIEKDEKYLMIHRTKKENDINQNKWVGVGGRFEENESPEECLLREVKEETGLELKTFKLRSVITYISDKWGLEYMYLFTSDCFEGDLIDCNEGDLKWIDKREVLDLPMWEGDKIFIEKLQRDDRFFTIKFEYVGEKMTKYDLVEY